jgi:hypothetical protein
MHALIRAFVIAAVFTSAAAGAGAQDRVGITLQAGVITGDDSAPFDDFSRPLFTASIQHVFARHFVIEGEASYWTLQRVSERGPHNVEGPQGVIGTVTGSIVEDSHSYFNYGVNALVKSTGPMRVFGGAGVGLSTDQNVYRQQSFGCSPSLDPRTCDEFVNDRGRGPIVMIRFLGGVEVPIASHVELVGTVRAERTAWEDRADWLSATAGLRFAFD